MKILITGSGGLVGSNLVECFQGTTHELLTPLRGELNLLNRSAEVYNDKKYKTG